MGGDRGVSNKRRFLACVEESQANIVIGRGRGGYERYFCVRKFTGDGHQGGVALAVGIEDDAGRIAGETSAGEGVYLEYAQACLRGLSREFCTHPSVRLHFVEP